VEQLQAELDAARARALKAEQQLVESEVHTATPPSHSTAEDVVRELEARLAALGEEAEGLRAEMAAREVRTQAAARAAQVALQDAQAAHAQEVAAHNADKERLREELEGALRAAVKKGKVRWWLGWCPGKGDWKIMMKHLKHLIKHMSNVSNNKGSRGYAACCDEEGLRAAGLVS